MFQNIIAYCKLCGLPDWISEMSSKIGVHLIGPLSHMLDTLQQWQPSVALVMDPTKDSIRDLRRRVPNATIIGRIYVPDAELEDRIRDKGWLAADIIAEEYGLFRKMSDMPEVNYWQINNEILQTTLEGIWLLNDFSLELMEVISAYADNIGTNARAAIGCFGVGQPDLPSDNPLAYWVRFYRSLQVAADNGHLLLIHAYGAPVMQQPSPSWYLHRFEERVWPKLPDTVTNTLKYVYGEYGIDGGVLGSAWAKQGWRVFNGTKSYLGQIVQAEMRLREFPSCIGACLFNCGQFGVWQSFDIWPEVAKELAKWSQNNPCQPPLPVPVGPEQPGLAELAEACRWFSEEITRMVQSGNTKQAEELLVNTLTPRLYQLEERLEKVRL